MHLSDVNPVSPATEAPEASSSSLLLSMAALVGSVIEGACAILVASASAKVLVGIGALAATVKASRLHADAIRIPILVISAVCAVAMLVLVWNAWRSRRRPSARWRMRPLYFRKKLSFAVTLLSAVLTLVLVIAEAIEHPLFHLR